MDTVNIHCCNCGVDLLSDVPGRHAQEALLLCHAAVPHCGHVLHVHRNPAGEFATVRFSVACLHPQCIAGGAEEWDLDIDPIFANTYALAFHTAHEGHRLRVVIGNVVIESPRQI